MLSVNDTERVAVLKLLAGAERRRVTRLADSDITAGLEQCESVHR
jgi:hypothetical protein